MPGSSIPSPLNRREFLRWLTALGGATALAAFLEGCSVQLPKSREGTTSPSPFPTRVTPLPATDTPGPIATPEMSATSSSTPTNTGGDGTARIALVSTSNRAEGVRRALELLGINPFDGKRVFFKPNFNSADPAPGSTHPEVLTTLVAAIKEMGAQSITLGDRSGMGNTRRVMDQLGVFRLADEMGFNAMVFDELLPEDWLMIQPPDGHWQQGFPFARPCLEAEAVVNACCLKTHRFGGHFTLSLKNAVGMVAQQVLPSKHDYMQELHASAHQRRMIAEINTAYTPALIVLDGVEAFISGGPDRGERVQPEVILAGTDRIAMDAVGVALLRLSGCQTEVSRGKIFEQEQIARAVELGLGVDRPEKIEFLTGDASSAATSDRIREVLLAG